MPDDAGEMLTRVRAMLEDRYAIEACAGAGGMATVYRATDRKHGRSVAVKVLRPELAAVLGGERFLAEIQVTANLQHPNILPLFDSGSAGGVLYYVMPYVDGESLRDRLRREKQLPVNDVVAITTEIAGALDYAHRHGVIHRDIKPENILLHDGRALVADFGIALALTEAGGGRLTETGLSLGTPEYMSPEQATADRDLDGRSDVYSLGAVAYEMLTGDPPHSGNTVQGVIARILSDTPAPIGRSRSLVPPNVDAAVQVALAKSPADRFSTAAAFAEALRDPTFRLPATAAVVPDARLPNWRARLAIPGLVAAAVLLPLALWGWFRPTRSDPGPVVRYALTLPPEQRLVPSAGPSLALSPDGSRMVYVGPGDSTARQLWLRERDQLTGRPLTGTEDAWQPFFAPDGSRVAFITASRELKVTSLDDGVTVTLASSGIGLGGGHWGPDGYIYLTGTARGLVRVAASGGTAPQPVTEVTDSLAQEFHVGPWVLPDDHGVLFVIDHDHIDDLVAVVDPASGGYRVLATGEMAWYAPTGHLVTVTRDGAVLAAPFSLETLRVTGEPVLVNQLADMVRYDVALSPSGRMAWVRRPPLLQQAVWVDRQGRETPVDPVRPIVGMRYAALSPDGQRLAVNTRPNPPSDDGHIWIKTLPDGPLERFTFEGAVNFRPAWTSDGQAVLFISDRGGNRDVWIRKADGTLPPRLLVDAAEVIDEVQMSTDGTWLVYRSGKEDGQRDIMARRLEGDTLARPLAASEFDEVAPALSPDGRWLAFVSTESGEPNVYVRPFPSADAQWRISTDGGLGPVWAPDGSELYYTNRDADLVAVPILPGTSFRRGEKIVLFSATPYLRDFYHPAYSAAPDGRFVMIREYRTDDPQDDLVMVENWFAELARAMGTQ